MPPPALAFRFFDGLSAVADPTLPGEPLPIFVAFAASEWEGV